ncbi:MAG: prolyl oligopeptidase family serine peptidase [Gammaproteobacteria bacterium]|nr:prolyl oligopeptidase family serine peptidase [Gammaproteobacteria bacterium]
MNAWIHDAVIDQVQVNFNGSRLVALTLGSVNDAPDVTVWETRDLSKAPRRFRPDDSKVIGVTWLNDDTLFVVGRQKFDYRVGASPTFWFRDIAYIVDAKGKRFRKLMGHRDDIQSAQVVNLLTNDPDKVLISVSTLQRTQEFLELNLDRLTTNRVFRGDDRSSFGIDTLGNVATRQVIEGGGDDVHIVTSLKNPETNAWEEHFKLYAREREGVGLGGITITADGTIYVNDNSGRDKAVVRTYDAASRKLSDPVFEHDDYEIAGLETRRFPNPGESDLIGYYVDGPDRQLVYTDPTYRQLQAQIDAALPDDQVHRITSATRNMDLVVIRSSGPREPGSFSLLVSGRQLIPLGRAFPNLDPAELAPMEFVRYEARDGLEIPAFLTTPTTGQAPYPTVIMPHGGPWARDYLGWDRWAQFLANRGYAVLQPQYRGSEGWGQKLWRAGDREWGQKMQDDKDDGARWLVDQGIAAEDRIAIYGYSYGGYAAMAATVRPNSPYQCAIAGAGLSELDTFDKITFENPFNREFQNPTIGGLSPLYEADEAGIPIFIFHGDRDQRVPVDQSRKFHRALQNREKDTEYLEIPDLWHSLPWFPQHHLAVLSSLERYLAEDCGPGGL